MDGTPERGSAQDAARRRYEEVLGAWNRRDARGFAALFVPDGLLVGFDGSQVRGSEVEDHLTPIFANHPTATFVSKVRDVRPLGRDAVVLHAIVGMVPPGQTDLEPAVNAVQTLVAEFRDGTWSVALFQNTPAAHHGRPELVEQQTEELRQVLKGASEQGL
ncbi:MULTISPECIES: SgcJ/EcaC family oxidoreductase [unclassified Streptomyces]|uniref:SgcJ/EcaC family oxidoreductase n=1 Tax=unclassified Streptomyces TaxID=2593676 RepID=UPI002258D92F|nr:SgcJ/EcaC family oxidoreductase [Streptomyces sp. NBC_01500]MCX4553346.1 SgcJ/EcaC family oxidoreductase [Streptomyces sp. NBC_01500]WSV52351.1 SgcJ/EcaC family oxidoreductase [Streptomyces sp. NBC_01014]